jgi:hypothetical protein
VRDGQRPAESPTGRAINRPSPVRDHGASAIMALYMMVRSCGVVYGLAPWPPLLTHWKSAFAGGFVSAAMAVSSSSEELFRKNESSSPP